MLCRRSVKIILKSGVFIALAVAVILLPVKFVTAWCVAVFIHELSHILSLCVLQVEIYSITFGLLGAVINTEPMPRWKEFICAIAGPVGGFLLIPLAKWIPLTAVFACFQSFYNLLPIFPFDGGRVVRTALSERAARNVENVVIVLLALICFYLTFILRLGSIAIVGFFVFLFKNSLQLKGIAATMDTLRMRRGACNDKQVAENPSNSPKTCQIYRR